MRTWHRSPVVQRCGRCGELIPKDEPYEAIQTARPLRRPKVRCRACAETAEPAELLTPSVPTQPLRPLSFARFTDVPFDYKQAQSRDPGEDG